MSDQDKAALAQQAVPSCVWVVENRTSFGLFATKADADAFLSKQPPSVAGGMHVGAIPVIGAAPAAPQAEQRAVPAPEEVERLAQACRQYDTRLMDEAAAMLRKLAAQQAEREPIDMVLHCPKCGMQHIDAPERKDCGDCHRGGCEVGKCSIGAFTAKMYLDSAWKNPPHRSHLCHGCGHVWRPADVPTNGVQAVKTKGKADSPVAQQAEREPLTSVLRVIANEIAHAEINGHELAPSFGRVKGEPAVSVSNVIAAIEGGLRDAGLDADAVLRAHGISKEGA